jgi:hypothetical protein
MFRLILNAMNVHCKLVTKHVDVIEHVTLDVRHNDDGICTIVSLVFCVTVDYPASEISNHIHVYQVTSKQQRCSDISFIDRNKEHRITAG